MDLSLPDDCTLSRLAATLLALALLAERAGCRSFPVRWLVLAILRRAEVAVEVFLAEATRTRWPCVAGRAETGASRRDATFLALRLRTLAAVVETLRRHACLLECCRLVRPQARRPRARPPEAASGGRPPRPADTS